MTDMARRETPLDRRGALFALAAAALALATLGGCGRRSMPKAPEGSTYDQPYPTRRSMGLPPEDTPPVPKDDEDETTPPAGAPRPPALRY
jgi:hypothetical protein